MKLLKGISQIVFILGHWFFLLKIFLSCLSLKFHSSLKYANRQKKPKYKYINISTKKNDQTLCNPTNILRAISTKAASNKSLLKKDGIADCFRRE